jgi:NitT/TauT family transport system substrate-binding protein
MLRGRTALLVTTTLLLALSACADPKTDQAGGTPTKVVVQYGWLLDGGSAPACTALVKGYYERAGLDVTLKPGGPVAATFLNATNAVATNSAIDIAVDNDLVTLIEGRSSKPDAYNVHAFGTLWQESPLGFIVREDSGITSLKDLARPKANGKKPVIGSTPGAPIFKALADYAGVTVADLNITNIGGDASPLIAGKIDALLGFSTNQAVAVEKAGIPYRFLPVSELPGFTQPVYVALARDEVLRRSPDLLSRWLRATVDGAREVIRDPKAAASHLLDRRCGGPTLKVDQQQTLIEKTLPYMKYQGSYDKLGQMNVEMIKTFIGAYCAAAGLSKVPDVGEIVDTSIVGMVYGA